MSKLLVILLCFLQASCEPDFSASHLVYSSDPWILQLGDETEVPGEDTSETDICTTLITDHVGNIYCAGYTTSNLGEESYGTSNAFVMKLNYKKEIVWLKQFGSETILPNGGTSGFEVCNALALDKNRNLYCAGGTEGGTFGESPGGGVDAFVMKLDYLGNIVWIKQLGEETEELGYHTDGDESCLSVDLDEQGNIYCGGFTSSDLNESNGGNNDIFVLKLKPNGDIAWVKQLGAVTTYSNGTFTGSSSGNESCVSLVVDGEGNIYCTGSTTGDLGEDNGGSTDAYIMKMNSSGALVWIRQIGADATIAGHNSSSADTCLSIKVDGDLNAYCGGNTSGSLGEANGGSTDAFVMKLNSTGNIVWIKQLGNATIGGVEDNFQDSCNAIVLDANQTVYCGGHTYGDLGEDNIGVGTSDALMFAVSSAGALLDITQFGGDSFIDGNTVENERCNSISYYRKHIFCGGFTDGNIGEDNGGNSASDIMVAKVAI